MGDKSPKNARKSSKQKSDARVVRENKRTAVAATPVAAAPAANERR